MNVHPTIDFKKCLTNTLNIPKKSTILEKLDVLQILELVKIFYEDKSYLKYILNKKYNEFKLFCEKKTKSKECGYCKVINNPTLSNNNWKTISIFL